MSNTDKDRWEDLKKRHFHHGEPRDWSAFDKEVLALITDARLNEVQKAHEMYDLHMNGQYLFDRLEELKTERKQP